MDCPTGELIPDPERDYFTQNDNVLIQNRPLKDVNKWWDILDAARGELYICNSHLSDQLHKTSINDKWNRVQTLNHNPQMQQKHGVLFDKQFTCMIYDWVLQTASYGVCKHVNALTG